MRNINFCIILILGGYLLACSTSKNTLNTSAPIKNSAPSITEEKKKELEYLFVEALKQKMVGNPQKAVGLLSAVLEIDPNSSAAMFELANLHVANNDLTSASLLLEKAIDIDPQNKWFKLLLSTIYQKTGKPNEAVSIYNQLLKIEPENQEYLYSKAILLSMAKKYDESIKAFNELEKKTGINEQLSLTKQKIFIEAGKTKEAFAEIQRLIDSNPSEPRYYGLMADLYLDQGDNANALLNYNKVIQIDPQNGFVQFSLAEYYLQEGDSAKAFEYYLKAFESPEVDMDTKLQMYLLHTGENSPMKLTPAQNQQLLDVLSKANSDDFRIHTLYAEYLIRNKRTNEARSQLLKVVDLGINDFMVWEQILYLDNELQEWQTLYDHSKTAVELFPNQPQFYFLHAVACIQVEKYSETIAVSDEGLNYVVQNKPLEGQLLMLKGEAFYKQNNHNEAFILFEKAIKADPENFIAMNNYAYYLSEAERDLEKAERMSGKVVERFPDNPTYLDTYAWVLFKKKNYPLAKFYMETAINKDSGTNATLCDHYGDILIMLDKPEEALIYWKKAKELGSDSKVLDQKIKEKRYIAEKK